jgi:hypothetical protein
MSQTSSFVFVPQEFTAAVRPNIILGTPIMLSKVSDTRYEHYSLSVRKPRLPVAFQAAAASLQLEILRVEL